LPVGDLQAAGRDVQALRTDEDGAGFDPTRALRTALRLGNGALVVGEVRGEEAQVLYEAMRVGAHSEAVLGTIHGDGASDTYERVVSDLGVAPSSFAATDLVVTLELTESATQSRRVRAIEEVTGRSGPAFETLFDRSTGSLAPTGRIDRGNSRLVETVAGPGDAYASVRERLRARADRLTELVATGREPSVAATAPEDRER